MNECFSSVIRVGDDADESDGDHDDHCGDDNDDYVFGKKLSELRYNAEKFNSDIVGIPFIDPNMAKFGSNGNQGWLNKHVN